ncbi:VRR-NUC domain-containing protein [Prevotella bivia]|uniref:VRR-NUC domain-containing protein n=1 Tax=Prevotella bivia TaxID=28125 RepID=UPI00288A3A65|nr:VRR-NUC domain-containing protein [Prevotella bivia]
MTLEEMIAKKKATTRKRPSDEEHRIQCSCVRWFNLKHRKLKGRLFAVPNGGKRDALTGAKLKAEGVVAGVADLILLVPNRFYGALLVEMKTLTGRQSKSQKDWEQIITSEGDYKYVVCHSLDDFIREVDDYIKYCD